MAEKKVNVLKEVVVVFHGVLKVMSQHLADNAAKEAMLRSLGLDPSKATTPLNLPAGTMNSIQAYVDQSDDNVDIEAFGSVVEDLISVSNAIDSFIQLVSNEDPEIATEFFDMMMNLYLMEYVRLRTDPVIDKSHAGKYFYSICKAIYFYEELATESGGLAHFTASIFNLVGKVWNAGTPDTEEDAQLLSDTIFLALAVLSYSSGFVRDNIKIQYGFEPIKSPLSDADRLTRRALTFQLGFKSKDLEGNELSAATTISLLIKPEKHGGHDLVVFTSGSGGLERKFGNFIFSFEIVGTPVPEASFKIKREAYDPLLIGDTKASHLKIGQPSFALIAAPIDNTIKIECNTKDSAFLLKKGDSFLTSFMPESGIYGNFDLGLGFDFKKGSLYFAGGSGLSLFIPLHIDIANAVFFNAVYLRLAAREDKAGVDLETSIGFTIKIFGFTAAVERIGILHNFITTEGKRNYRIGFKPPSGIGLSLDIGLLQGGGFLYFDNDKGEYFGALELTFPIGAMACSIKAIGMITTKMPDGSKGFSMLFILTFEGRIDLSFGFILAGLGGLIGVHRSVNIDLLKEGVKTNSIKSVLFPQDIIANMGRIISDLRNLFPPAADGFLAMPMLKLSWGASNLFSIEVGVLFGSGLEGVAILGVFKMEIPGDEMQLIRMQVNFLGVIDLKNQCISFDATLYDSRLLYFVLEGDSAFRLAWGQNDMFIFSSGGFHPAFRDAPGDLVNMKRISISLLSGNNPRLTIATYFAVTSNTFQHGSRGELYAAAFGFNIYGFIGYDVLFQFNPFKFIATFSAGVALRRGSSVLMSISVFGVITGPKPIDVRGEASFSFFFLEKTIPFHVTLGGDPPPLTQEEEDLLDRLRQEVTNDHSWKSELPETNSLHVTVKQAGAQVNQLLLHPFGSLSFNQRTAPLFVEVTHFGVKKIKGEVRKFEIQPADPKIERIPLTDKFAPASFFDLTDDQKLSSPSFQPMRSGFTVRASLDTVLPPPVIKSVDYELTYLRKGRKKSKLALIYKLSLSWFRMSAKAGAVTSSKLSFSTRKASVNAPDTVKVDEELFAIAHTKDVKAYNGDSHFRSQAEATAAMNTLLRKDPMLKGTLQVVMTNELNK